jgi:hypothetical protein
MFSLFVAPAVLALVASPQDGQPDGDTQAAVGLFGPLKVSLERTPEEEDLEQRIASLELLASQLLEQLQSDRSASVGEFTRLEELFGSVTDAGLEGAPISGFKVGDTTLRIGGFVDFDFHGSKFSDGEVASGSPFRDLYFPGGIPLGADSTTATDMTAQATRFSATATRDFGANRAVAYLEADYLISAQGNERVSSSFAQRLRRAYIDFNGWRVGQEWTTFQDLSALPESASLVVLGEGLAFNRQAIIRYTNGPWQFAAENANTTVTEVDGSRTEADTGLIPDLVARYNFDGDYGHFSVAGLARQLRSESAALDDETFGFGLALQGRLKVGKRDQVRFSFVGGDGLGRYTSFNLANAAAVNPNDGNLDSIGTVGGQISYRHFVGDSARINVGIGAVNIDNPGFAIGSVSKSARSIFSSFLWNVAPDITAGVEVLHGTREIEDGTEGDVTRATFSVQYGF